MEPTAKKGILTYQDSDNKTTTVSWFNPDMVNNVVNAYYNRVVADGGTVEAINCVRAALFSPDQTREFCGTEDPLSIKWGGDRYSTTAPSSASIRLMIQSLEDRQFLEDLFNGGYEVVIEKEDIGFYWYGQLTPTLSIGAYKSYPYKLVLNANDGLATAKNKQFLMIDFPEPWPGGKVTILDLIIKLININLYPKAAFIINVAMRITPMDVNANDLSDIYVDPRVLMEADEDQYISNEKVLSNLLGPLGLQMVQWMGDWWLLDLEAQWDAGKITYNRYSVNGEQWDDLGEVTQDLGILDMYSCDVNDIEVRSSGMIDFVAPWRNATIRQTFQMNSCILPVYANRTGSFYHGHTQEGGSTFMPLEYKQMLCAPCTGNLRHWLDEGLILNQWPNFSKDNTSFVWVETVKSGQAQTKVAVSIAVDAGLTFNKFTFSVNTMPTYKGEPNSLEGQFTPKTNIEIKYVDTDNNTWWFWLNNGVGDFYGWNSEFRLLEFDIRNINIEALMPDSSAFTGGTFTIKIYNSDDENAYGVDYGMLINNLQIGIVSSSFQTIRVDENNINMRKRMQNMLKTQIAWAIIDPVGFVTSASGAIALETFNQFNNIYKRNNKDAVGGIKQGHYEGSDFEWDNTISVDINPKAEMNSSFAYIWGLTLLGVTSSHDLHLSSPYTRDGVPLESFDKVGETGSLPMLDWKSRSLIRDNSEYTSKLSGEYLSDKISPLQLIHDFEGRIYKFNNGTWNDKQGTWSAAFMEFKAIQNVPTQPTKCDFSEYDMNDDFCKEIPAVL